MVYKDRMLCREVCLVFISALEYQVKHYCKFSTAVNKVSPDPFITAMCFGLYYFFNDILNPDE